MSTQQVNPSLIQTRSVKPSEEVVELAGSRAPPKLPERQRGLWSFLTWSFVLGPIMAAESFLGKDGHALAQAAEDQDNPNAVHEKGPLDSISDEGQALAAVPMTSEDGRDDSDASQFVGAARGALPAGELHYGGNPIPAKPVNNDVANADPSSSGGGGDLSDTNASTSASSHCHASMCYNSDGLSNDALGGGISDNSAPGGSPGVTLDSLPNPIAVGASAAPDGGIPDNGAPGGLPGVIPDSSPIPIAVGASPAPNGGIPDNSAPAGSHGVTLDSLPNPTAVVVSAAPDEGIPHNSAPDGSPGGGIPDGLPIPIAVGASPGEALNVDVSVGGEPILAHASSDVVVAVGIGLPDILSPVGVDTSVDLKDVLGFDLHVNAAGAFVATDLSTALDVNPSQLVANVVSTAISPVTAEALPLLDLGVPSGTDGLLGGNNIGHPNVVTSEVSSVLGSDVGGALKQSGGALMTSPESGSDIKLPVVSLVSDLTSVGGVVGEGTDIASGGSINFPAQALPQGNVLFTGNSYTDYNMALQTHSSSGAGNIIAETLTSVTASPSQADAPVVSHDAGTPPPAPEHQDASLNQISTALVSPAVDQLSVTGHVH